jgi:tRNA pseudouridine55 synthase
VSSAEHRRIPPDIIYTPPHRPASTEDGAVFPVDKPEGETSFDVVRTVRRAIGVRKVGHAGTLDPMATGLLIVLAARPATRLQEAFMALEKEYVATIRLGETTPSHDTETEVSERHDASHLTVSDVEDVRPQFEGTINQVPPMYSALKVDGERLYEKARRGEEVDRPPRQVTIRELSILEKDGDDVRVRVVCSKGTYIRSLARDIGAELGVGAHLTALRRTRIGSFHVDDAWALDALCGDVETDAAKP